jgi:hypothetical protein
LARYGGAAAGRSISAPLLEEDIADEPVGWRTASVAATAAAGHQQEVVDIRPIPSNGWTTISRTSSEHVSGDLPIAGRPLMLNVNRSPQLAPHDQSRSLPQRRGYRLSATAVARMTATDIP